MHERECKGYISFNRGVNELNRGVNELNRGVNELNRGVNDLNRGVNHSVARQGCNLLRAAVTSAVTSQGCCCGNLQIHPLDLGQVFLTRVRARPEGNNLETRLFEHLSCFNTTISTLLSPGLSLSCYNFEASLGFITITFTQ